MEEFTSFDRRDIEENKVLAAVSYLSILVLIPLLVKKDSEFVTMHAKQGFILFIAEAMLGIVWMIFAWMPILRLIILILILIAIVAIIIVSIVGLINALMGQFWKIPYIYNWSKDVEENKVLAAISYLGILVLIPLLMKKDSKFVKEHAKQGLVLFIAEIVLWIVEAIFAWIPVLGLIISILVWLILVAIAIVSIIGLVYALQGKFWKIPFVYDWAQNFKI